MLEELNLVSWLSKKQVIVTRSSTETEYRSVATTAQELEPIRSLLMKLRVEVPNPLTILTCNIGVMHPQSFSYSGSISMDKNSK